MEVQVIEKIQGRIDRTTGLQINRKLKVAAYARVSTDSEDQLNSFESQVKYYNEKITKNIEWSFVEVYADESISRFARNKTGTKNETTKRRTNWI